MNLTKVLKRDAAIEDHSLVDHSWWHDTGLSRVDDPILNIDSMRNPNNVKPELEVEWGLGGPTIDLDEPAGVVRRNVPEENLGDANAVILFARDMMNRGYRGRQVVASLRKRYPAALLAKAGKGLRSMFALEGIVGRVMVDARGYKNCQAAVKATANSPFKGFIRYVYGCSCGDPHVLPMNQVDVFDPTQASSGNGLDAFLACEVKADRQMVAHCRSTMLPIMSAQGDLDKSFLDNTLIEMMNLTPVPESVIKKVKAMSISNLAKVRAAFRWLDKQVDAGDDARYAGAVDANAFKIRQADNEIDFFGQPMDELPVDGTNPSLMTDIEPENPFRTNFDGPANLPGIMDDVELMEPGDQSQIPIEVMDGENPAELTLREDVPAPGQIDLDERSGELDVELFDSPQGLDVEMSQVLDPEFEGTDEIALDAPQGAPTDLDVDMNQDMIV